VDSGASHHMTPVVEHLSSVKPSHMSHVYMADDTPIPVEGMGDVVVHGPGGIVTIRDCHCIPMLAQPMLSVVVVYRADLIFRQTGSQLT